MRSSTAMTHPSPLQAPTLEDIRAAHARIAGEVVRTPLVRLGVDGPAEIYLKLENLQPIGSFKLRGAANAMAQASDDQLARGVYTASAGNMAQGVAWCARARGIACGVIVPDTAPEAKLAAITRLGAEIVKVPFAEWWDVLVTRRHSRFAARLFIHPVSDRAVMAGNGTIGLEIAEALPAPDAVIIPFGGGGLSTGIASALRALHPQTRIYAAEPETAAPLAASLAAGAAQDVAYTPSFVDGIGSKSLLAEMWPIVRGLVDGSFAMPLAAIADAIRVLVERNRVVAEGAGATPVAAALAGRAGTGRIVCVVSGGNIDRAKLVKILGGELP
jgi:threonine dehydratase